MMDKKEQKKVGRPKKTINDLNLPKDWQDLILSYYEQGMSDVEVRVKMKINWRQWRNLMEVNEEFRTTIKNGHEIEYAWWLTMGRKNLGCGLMNHGLWYMNMKNRFNWSDKNEIQVEHSGTITHKTIDDKVKELSDKTPEQVIAEILAEIQDDTASESK